MFLNCTRIVGGIAVTALFALGGAAQAQTPITPGTSQPVPTIGFLGGTQLSLISTTFGDSQNGQTISGTFLSAVYQGGNSANTSYLDFYYQFTNNASSNQGIQSVSLASFAGTGTAIGQTTADIDGTGPFTAGTASSANANRSGGQGAGILFDYGINGVVQGSTSTTMVIRTTSVAYNTTGSAAFIGTAGISANSNGLVIGAAPTAAPEPGSLALLGTGALALGGVAVRRRKK